MVWPRPHTRPSALQRYRFPAPPYLEDDAFNSVTMHLSIMIPVYNEPHNVARLYMSIYMMLKSVGYRFQVVFVDDSSDDETLLAP